MTRRTKGEGNIYLRSDGRWEARITLPSADGKQRRRSFFGKNSQEALRKLKAAQRKIEVGAPLPPERLTVGPLDTWLAQKEEILRLDTLRRYKDYVRLYFSSPSLAPNDWPRWVSTTFSIYTASSPNVVSQASRQRVHGVCMRRFRMRCVGKSSIATWQALCRLRGEARPR